MKNLLHILWVFSLLILSTVQVDAQNEQSGRINTGLTLYATPFSDGYGEFPLNGTIENIEDYDLFIIKREIVELVLMNTTGIVGSIGIANIVNDTLQISLPFIGNVTSTEFSVVLTPKNRRNNRIAFDFHAVFIGDKSEYYMGEIPVFYRDSTIVTYNYGSPNIEDLSCCPIDYKLLVSGIETPLIDKKVNPTISANSFGSPPGGWGEDPPIVLDQYEAPFKLRWSDFAKAGVFGQTTVTFVLHLIDGNGQYKLLKSVDFDVIVEETPSSDGKN